MSRSAGCFHRREASTWDRREASASPRRGGFSLIELLLVVMVLGILAAMVTPELAGSRQEALLRAAARQLVGTFRLAYSQAVTTQQTVTFL
jgi:type II secretion system protein H